MTDNINLQRSATNPLRSGQGQIQQADTKTTRFAMDTIGGTSSTEQDPANQSKQTNTQTNRCAMNTIGSDFSTEQTPTNQAQQSEIKTTNSGMDTIGGTFSTEQVATNQVQQTGTQTNSLGMETIGAISLDQIELLDRTLNTNVEYDILTFQVPTEKKTTKSAEQTAAELKMHDLLSKVRVFLNRLSDLYSPLEKLGDQENIYLKIQGFLDLLTKTDPKTTTKISIMDALDKKIQDFTDDIAEAKRLITAKAEGTLTVQEDKDYPKTGTPLDAIKARITTKDPKTNQDLVDSLFSQLIVDGKLKSSAPPTESKLFEDVSNSARRLISTIGSFYSIKDQVQDNADVYRLISGITKELNSFPESTMKKADAIKMLKYLDDVTTDINNYQQVQQEALKEPSTPQEKTQQANALKKLENYKSSIFYKDVLKGYQSLFPGKEPPLAPALKTTDYMKMGIEEVSRSVRKMEGLFNDTEKLGDYNEAYHRLLTLKDWFEKPPAQDLPASALLKLVDKTAAIEQRITEALDDDNPTHLKLLQTSKDLVLGDIKDLSNTLFGKIPEEKVVDPTENFRTGSALVRYNLRKLDDLLSATAQNADKSPDGNTPLSLAHRQITGILNTLYGAPDGKISEATLKTIVEVTDGFDIYIKNSQAAEEKRLLAITENQFKNEKDPAWDPYTAGDAEEIYWQSSKETKKYSVTDALNYVSKLLLGKEPPVEKAPTDTQKLELAASKSISYLKSMEGILSEDDQLGTYHTTYIKMNALAETLASATGNSFSQGNLMKVLDITDRVAERMSWIDAQYQAKYEIPRAQYKADKETYNAIKETYDKDKKAYTDNTIAYDKSKDDYDLAKSKYEDLKKDYEKAKANGDSKVISQALDKMKKAEAAMNKAKDNMNTLEAAKNKSATTLKNDEGTKKKAEDALQKDRADMEAINQWKESMKAELKPTIAKKMEELSQLVLGQAAPLGKEPTTQDYFDDGSRKTRGLLERIEGIFSKDDRSTNYPELYNKLEGLIVKTLNSEGNFARETLRKVLSIVDASQKKLDEINKTEDPDTRQSRLDDYKTTLDKTLLTPLNQYFK